MRGCLSGLALALLLALLLLALFALVVLGLIGLVALLGFDCGLLGLHFLLLGLDAELFVDARLEEGAKLLGIAPDEGVLRPQTIRPSSLAATRR